VVQLPVHNFSNGLLNPGLGYLMSCLGSFLGLRCLTRARAYTGWARATWLLIASVAVGATGIWLMHFIAMLGFTIPGQQILYNVPVTLISLLVAVLVVAIGLFIVGYGGRGLLPVLAGGVIVGIGVSIMHYVGMSAMSMQGTVRYNQGLVAVSVLIAIVAGTAALLAGLHVSGVWSSLGVSLIMGVAVTGMHYTGMAAMRVYAGGGGMVMSGSSAGSFLFPLLLGAVVLTFLLALIIAMSPNEEEIRADQGLTERLRPVDAVSAAEVDGSRAWANLAGAEVDASRTGTDASRVWANVSAAAENDGRAWADTTLAPTDTSRVPTDATRAWGNGSGVEVNASGAWGSGNPADVAAGGAMRPANRAAGSGKLPRRNGNSGSRPDRGAQRAHPSPADVNLPDQPVQFRRPWQIGRGTRTAGGQHD
jgi:NO-binding membrane sensor protein with MHYT domain